MADTELGDALLRTARAVLDRAFGNDADRNTFEPRTPVFALGPLAPGCTPALDLPGATFVTLTQHGELRGCIGTLEAHRPLRVDVEENTLAAAFRDPRFAPLVLQELPSTRIEVSLLSAPAPLTFADERDLWRQLAPRVDGVVLEWRGRRATFLPQVWESLPDPRRFMAALKHKAGMAADFWHDNLRVSRYTVDKWKEPAADYASDPLELL